MTIPTSTMVSKGLFNVTGDGISQKNAQRVLQFLKWVDFDHPPHLPVGGLATVMLTRKNDEFVQKMKPYEALTLSICQICSKHA